MERLTKTYEDGVHGKADNIWWRDSDGLAEYIEQVVDRLAEYEDTGLTPEEIVNGKMLTGWIPVDERPPDKDGFYFATMEGDLVGDSEPFSCIWEFKNGVWDEPDFVLAWMPMPEPYKRREKE